MPCHLTPQTSWGSRVSYPTLDLCTPPVLAPPIISPLGSACVSGIDNCPRLVVLNSVPESSLCPTIWVLNAPDLRTHTLAASQPVHLAAPWYPADPGPCAVNPKISTQMLYLSLADLKPLLSPQLHTNLTWLPNWTQSTSLLDYNMTSWGKHKPRYKQTFSKDKITYPHQDTPPHSWYAQISTKHK